MATEERIAAREPDPYHLDRRLTILETRFDTVLPTLATKADLAELRSELKTLFITMVLGFAGMVLGFAGLILTMLNLLHR